MGVGVSPFAKGTKMVDLKDEVDYGKEDRQDLVARLMSAQLLGQFMFKAYDALRHYEVDYKLMPEWSVAVGEWDDARKLKPHKAQEAIVNSLVKLDHALAAAIRRKQFKLASV